MISRRLFAALSWARGLCACSFLILICACSNSDKADNEASNNPPVAFDRTVAIIVNHPGEVKLQADDPDFDLLQYYIVDQPANGTLVKEEVDTWRYIPNADFEGTDTLTFRANDGIQDSNIATVTLNVALSNHSPVAYNGSAVTERNVPVAITLSATDADNDPLTYSIVDGFQPAHGTIAPTGNPAVWTYTPAADYYGDDSFKFRAGDGRALSNVATVNIAIGYNPSPPVANDMAVATVEDIDLANILFDASDPEGHPLSFTIDSTPGHGTVTVSGSRFTYTITDPNFNGTDTFTYHANNGFLDSAVRTVTITVTPANDTPVAHNITVTILKDGAKTFNLVGTDVDGDSLSYVIESGPDHEQEFNTSALPLCSYTPTPGYVGYDYIYYHVSDATGNSNTATVTLIIRNDNIIFVKSDATGKNDGSSWIDAFTDPQEAVEAADSGDQIWFAKGEYKAKAGRDALMVISGSSFALYGGFDGIDYNFGSRDADHPEDTILNGDMLVPHVIHIQGTIQIDGFTITGGKGSGTGDSLKGGGVLNNSSGTSIADCIIKTNENTFGGGVYNDGDITLNNCLFDSNSAYNGGAIFNAEDGTIHLNACDFISNHVTYSGGAFFSEPDSMTTMVECVFGNVGNNLLKNTAEFFGGACAIYGDASITNCEFYYSTAHRGGALYDYTGDSHYHNCAFSYNAAADGYGGAVYNVGPIDVTDCFFEYNTALNGGAIYNDGTEQVTGPDAVYYSLDIGQNSAAQYGGGIYNEKCSPLFELCQVHDNTANAGGGFFNYSNGSPTINDCDIKNNLATGTDSYGGGIYCDKYSSPIIGDGTVISGNTAGSMGGGLYCTLYSDPRIDSAIITGNTAPYGAGCAIMLYSSPYLIHTTLQLNTAAAQGGGLYCDKSLPKLVNCLISANKSTTGTGGAVYNWFSTPKYINCTIADNVSSITKAPDPPATFTGGIANYGGTTLVIVNTIVFNNTTIYTGDTNAEIYNDTEGTPSVTDASFSLVKGNPYPCYPAGDNVADTGFVFVFPYYYSETSQCVDKGDPATEPDHLDIDTLDELFNRTVHTSGALDTNPVDLGYHYLP